MNLAENVSRSTEAASQRPQPPEDLGDWAFFLDVDGTLLDIAPSPDGVRVPPGLPELLDRLRERLGGALALVTGREIVTVDEFFAPMKFTVAGIHGAELRFPDGTRRATPVSAAMPAITEELRAYVSGNDGLLLEEKGRAVAVHYRLNPELGEEVEAHVRHVVERDGRGLEIQPGKMVVEVRPAGVDKGRAVELFLEEEVFAGRSPLVMGDDWTDEAAFRTANARGGRSIRIGRDKRATEAAERLDDPAAVRAWLAELLQVGLDV